MSGAEIATYLKQKGVSLRLAGRELEIDAPEGVLTPKLIERIRERKGELRDFLQQSTTQPEDWKERCTELFETARAQAKRNLDAAAAPTAEAGWLSTNLVMKRPATVQYVIALGARLTSSKSEL
jgi:hypothetical protein